MKTQKSKNKVDEGIIEFFGKKFKLPEFKEDEVDVKSFTEMNTRNYENDLERLPGLLNLFGVTVAKALKKKMLAETNYKVWVAVNNRVIRANFEKSKTKYTESKIDNEIHSNPEYLVKKKAIHKAEETYEILKSIYWAIQKKGDILLELSKQRSNLKKLDNARVGRDN